MFATRDEAKDDTDGQGRRGTDAGCPDARGTENRRGETRIEANARRWGLDAEGRPEGIVLQFQQGTPGQGGNQPGLPVVFPDLTIAGDQKGTRIRLVLFLAEKFNDPPGMHVWGRYRDLVYCYEVLEVSAEKEATSDSSRVPVLATSRGN